MAEYTPRRLGDDIADLEDLCAQVQENIDAGYRKDPVYEPFSDVPVEGQGATLRHVIFDLFFTLGWVVAAIAIFFSVRVAVGAGVVSLVMLLCRVLINRFSVAPAQRWMRECVVRPAVVAQAYHGGFKPPADDPAPSFTGIVVFSFDEGVGAQELLRLARSCAGIKHRPATPELAELKEMLLTGDNEFVRGAYRWPESIAGNDQTFAAPILWLRRTDLLDGYLSTDVQLVFVHPDKPEHPMPVPPSFWEGRRSRELLSL